MSDEVLNLLKENFGDNLIENKNLTTNSSYFYKNNIGENFKNLNLDYKKNKIGDIKMNNDMNFVNDMVKSKSTKKINSLNFKMPIVKK